MQVTFHIGAHRTGSSLVARTLAASVAAQPGCGVAVWRPVQVRKIDGFTGLHRYEGARRDRIRADIAQRVESAAQNGAGQLILSEENMPGTMSSNLRRGAFYPEIEHRLQRYAEALPIAPSRIAIGVRSYAAVWSSAYYYSLQRGKTVPGPEAVRQAMMEDARGWIGFVNAARPPGPTCL